MMLALSGLKSKKILVVELSRLGDVVCISPTLSCLREAFPSFEITVVADQLYGDLLARNPALNKVVVVSRTATVRGLLMAINLVRKEKYGIAISMSPSKRNCLVASLSRARYKTGYFTLRTIVSGLQEASVNTFGFRAQEHYIYKRNDNIVERGLHPIRAIGVKPSVYRKKLFVPVSETEEVRRYLSGVRNNHFLVTIQPCSGWSQRDWPQEYVKKLVYALEDCDIFLLGSEKDRERIKSIASASKGNVFPWVGVPIIKVAALIKESDVFLGPDSGLMHIADAVGTRMVALFGPSIPALTGPLRENATVIHKRLSCSPCMQRKCAAPVTCMKMICCDEVLEAMRNSLNYNRATWKK